MRRWHAYAAGVALGGALAWACGPIADAVAHERVVMVTRDPGPTHRSWASWYGPGFYGHGVACTGRPLGLYEMNAAALDHVPCGTRVTFYYRGRRALATVTDRGAFGALGRTWDLGPGVRAALNFYGVIQVGWRYGWPQPVRVRIAHCHAIRVGDGARRRCARSWSPEMNRRILRHVGTR